MWNHLIHLAAHAVKGYFERRAGQRDALPELPGYSFEQHMRCLSGQTGVPLMVLKPGRATFEPCFRGSGFITVLLNQAPDISIGMFSNIRFSRGRIPAVVRGRLPGLSSGNGFRLDTIDCDDGSFIIAEVSGPAATLTPMAFMETLEEMMHRLALIDAWIVEQGYA